jgi:hypothetical protein
MAFLEGDEDDEDNMQEEDSSGSDKWGNDKISK